MTDTEATEAQPLAVSTPSKVELSTDAEGGALQYLDADLIERIRNADETFVAEATEGLSTAVASAFELHSTAVETMVAASEALKGAYVQLGAWDTGLRLAFNSLDGSNKRYQDNFGAAISKAVPFSEMDRVKRVVRYHTDYVMREILGQETIEAAGLDPRTRRERQKAGSDQRKAEKAQLNAEAQETIETLGEAVSADVSVEEGGDILAFAGRVNYWASKTQVLIEHAPTVTTPDAVARELESAMKHCRDSIKRIKEIGTGTPSQEAATG